MSQIIDVMRAVIENDEESCCLSTTARANTYLARLVTRNLERAEEDLAQGKQPSTVLRNLIEATNRLPNEVQTYLAVGEDIFEYHIDGVREHLAEDIGADLLMEGVSLAEVSYVMEETIAAIAANVRDDEVELITIDLIREAEETGEDFEMLLASF